MHSRRNPRKKLNTPGNAAGVEFEAVQGQKDSSYETFSYEDVYDLSTITPTAKRRGKSASTTAVGAAKTATGGSPAKARTQTAGEKLSNGRATEGARPAQSSNGSDS